MFFKLSLEFYAADYVGLKTTKHRKEDIFPIGKMVVKMKIRKAVITAAGYGTRMLPATKSMPKEMLPILDKPAIQ